MPASSLYGTSTETAEEQLAAARRRLAPVVRMPKVKGIVAEKMEAVVLGTLNHQTPQQLAADLGVTPTYVRKLLRWFRQAADLELVGVTLDALAVPKAVEVVMHHLSEQNRDVAVDVLKGRGLFKTHQAGRAEGPATQIGIAIQWVGDGAQTPPEGHVFGVPKELGGETA